MRKELWFIDTLLHKTRMSLPLEAANTASMTSFRVGVGTTEEMRP
jgi:hypothetical protein